MGNDAWFRETLHSSCNPRVRRARARVKLKYLKRGQIRIVFRRRLVREGISAISLPLRMAWAASTATFKLGGRADTKLLVIHNFPRIERFETRALRHCLQYKMGNRIDNE